MRKFLIVLALLITGQGVLAQEPESVGPFYLLPSDETVAVLAGEITSQTPLDFRTVLARRPNLETLILDSEGGTVSAGLLIADDIHFRQISTYIPRQAGCYSACAYAFLAGKSRVVEGELGVHQFYGGEESTERAQFVMSDILDMLAKFGAPQEVISRMLRTPSDDMYTFTASEIADLGINRGAKELRTMPAVVAALPAPITEAIKGTTASGSEGDASTSSAGYRFAVYGGVDFYGADIAKIRTEDLAQCLDACLELRQCKAITLNTNPALTRGPNCFLKAGTGRGEFYEQAISGVFLLPGESEAFQVGTQRVMPVEVFTPD